MIVFLYLLLGLSLLAFLSALLLVLRGLTHRRIKPMCLRVVQRIDHTTDLFTLVLRRNPCWVFLPLPRFKSGHAVQVNMRGMAVKRRYSLANWSLWPYRYRLTIKREPEGRLSSSLYEEAVEGTMLMVSRPNGPFWVERFDQPIVMVAGGVGITPMVSILQECLSKNKRSTPVSLYWQVRYLDEAMYNDYLESIARQFPWFTYKLLVSQHPETLKRERISANLLWNDAASKHNSHANYYLCAGPSLIQTMLDGLKGFGVAPSSLHYEQFNLGLAQSQDAWKINVGEKSIPIEGFSSILEALESASIGLAADCRTGSCGQCRLKVRQGKFKNCIEPEFRCEENELLACCSLPASDLEIELR